MVSRTLTGTYERVLDEKFRFAIPRPLRRQYSQEEELTLFVAPGNERSLSLFHPDRFHSLAEERANRATNGIEARTYFRLLFSQAEEATLDGQGRIRIPDRLVAYAGLKRDLVLLGVHDHAEIWDKDLWQEFLTQNQADFDRISSQAFG